jgi:hypothetical protein
MFYWVWDDKHNLTIEQTKPPNIKNSKSLQLSLENKTIDICLVDNTELNVEFNIESKIDFNPNSSPPDRICTNIPFLKSNLQKAIRRKNTDASLTSCQSMLLQDPPQLLRRLPIIATEDVRWTNWMNHIVWLMVWYGNQKNIISPQHWSFILGVVVQLSNMEEVFDYSKWNPLTFDFDIEKEWEKQPRDMFLFSMLVREKYGGTSNDKSLIKYTAFQYSRDPKTSILNIESVPLYIGKIDMKSDHFLPEAIDFHCSDILKKIQKQFRMDYLQLKKWMWDFRSSFNVRKPETHHTHKPFLWKKIEYEADRLSMEYWEKDTVPWVPRKKQRLITEFIS